ncbi:MAG: PhnD/SsuA/transferrin family substrate-binding protein [Candidatus Sumerlaeota bacterium]|nr:PhnD/SsuA/transferrin family substrate-binding protein [Candidatus Sumerlaeota bacterium]
MNKHPWRAPAGFCMRALLLALALAIIAPASFLHAAEATSAAASSTHSINLPSLAPPLAPPTASYTADRSSSATSPRQATYKPAVPTIVPLVNKSSDALATAPLFLPLTLPSVIAASMSIPGVSDPTSQGASIKTTSPSVAAPARPDVPDLKAIASTESLAIPPKAAVIKRPVPRLGNAISTAPLVVKGRRLRIGYHARTNETALTAGYFEQLAQFIARDPEMRKALMDAGFDASKVEALRADDHVDLVRRMSQDEFDLVFCSAVSFVAQTGHCHYVAFMQTRSRDDTWSANKGVYQYGAVIASRANPLFRGGLPDEKKLREFLKTSRMAVVSNHSAAGYLYPLLSLRRQFCGAPADLLFCDSSEEVAKFVINGLVDVGALDEKTLKGVMAQIPGNPDPNRFVIRILRTPPMPTDPVAIRSELAPAHSRLGVALAKAIKKFCESRRNEPIAVVEAPLDAYSSVQESYDEFIGKSSAAFPTHNGEAATSGSKTIKTLENAEPPMDGDSPGDAPAATSPSLGLRREAAP